MLRSVGGPVRCLPDPSPGRQNLSPSCWKTASALRVASSKGNCLTQGPASFRGSLFASRDWSTGEFQGPATLPQCRTILKGHPSPHVTSGLPEAFVGPLPQMDCSLCSGPLPSLPFPSLPQVLIPKSLPNKHSAGYSLESVCGLLFH